MSVLGTGGTEWDKCNGDPDGVDKTWANSTANECALWAQKRIKYKGTAITHISNVLPFTRMMPKALVCHSLFNIYKGLVLAPCISLLGIVNYLWRSVCRSHKEWTFHLTVYTAAKWIHEPWGATTVSSASQPSNVLWVSMYNTTDSETVICKWSFLFLFFFFF